MTRPVLLVRHAHAEWPHYQGRDFDRPLTPRGEADAMAAGRALQQAGHRPALLLVSPSLRTRQTAERIARELQLPDEAIRHEEALYNAPVKVLQSELRAFVSRHQGLVALVAHNPGISDLARHLSDDELASPFAPADWRLLHLAD